MKTSSKSLPSFMAQYTAQDDLYYMQEALKEAQQAYAKGEVPIGAIVVGGGRILGRGHNLVETLHDPSAHAEMLAITAACQALNSKLLSTCTLYVTIEPCPMCAGAIHWARLGQIVYGAREEKFGYQRYSPSIIHGRTMVRGGVLEDEARALMQSFFQRRR